MKKYVYAFIDGDKDMRDLLGGKGANLAQMLNLGLPIPPGFTITTEACLKYYENEEKLSDELLMQINKNIDLLEKESGKVFGDTTNPLLVSVRSGAPISMPGMMDSILNLGLNDEIVSSYDDTNNDNRYIYDSYRRLIGMYADVVIGAKGTFENILSEFKKKKKINLDNEMSIKDLQELINIYKEEYKKITKKEFPQDPYKQLYEAVKAVFRSWNNERAITYRQLNDIPSDLGTAVNVQMMVYGNKNNLSGTGVAFTRNPATGENKLFGEYLINAQGEDVVAGIRTPESIDKLEEIMPDIYKQFLKISKRLEKYYKDMQDMEFTIEDGKLYILQTRNGKRTGIAAIKIAIDLIDEEVISPKEAIFKVEPKAINDILHKTFKDSKLKDKKIIGKGLGASPGCQTGRIYFSASSAVLASKRGEKEIILVREETSAEDIEGMNVASGLVTLFGGMTSHAAVVARSMGTACVCGVNNIKIDKDKEIIILEDNKIIKKGDYISIDGTNGIVYEGKIELEEKEASEEYKTFTKLIDKYRRLKVYINADTARDALTGVKFGGAGIGLCRSEHMFFAKDRILNFRKMILADLPKERQKYLDAIMPYQQEDYEDIYTVMQEKPVVIRLLDPPLHEFLPKEEEEVQILAKEMGLSRKEIEQRINSLKEFNPMMGHRGCRLSITYPEIVKMQTTAIAKAAISISKKLNINIVPKIMIPLISDYHEIKFIKDIIVKTINDIDSNIKYKIGTMIELPRACLVAEEIAPLIDFISFGTNDLTQMTYGFSRDDAGKFLQDYYNLGLLNKDPFVSLDEKGVGRLVKMATEKARSVNKNIEIGICGEHGADDSSIDFCNRIGLNYVSCSPYRVIMAKLSAARANLRK